MMASEKPINSPENLEEAVRRVLTPLRISEADRGRFEPPNLKGQSRDGWGDVHVPAISPENLGDGSFRADLGIRYPYLAGSMANGISSCDLVEAMGRAGMLGFFGAAGLTPAEVESAVDRLQASLPNEPFGFNLIHSPHDRALEGAVVDLYLKRGIRLIEASAFLDLTLPLVRYRVAGIHRDPDSPDGEIVAPNRVIGKISRIEVATKFFSPPPEEYLRELVASGDITEEQAELASRIPVAGDLTAEADSGGHTDNRPTLALLPTILALRDRMQSEYNYRSPLRVGAAGGIATPSAAVGAFAMGAAYIMTASVNQACVESGSSDVVRRMLAETGQADVTMAPAADMFEMGVKVQVLKRGTMFAMRGAKLFEIYRSRSGLEDIPPTERAILEKTLFKAPLEEIWDRTREFFLERDPSQVERAERDPKHRMALVFRWYLGLSSNWANAGDPDRQMDYQVWCGPAMGAFNEWAKGSFLENVENRKVETVALNVLYGAAVLTRVGYLRNQRLAVAGDFASPQPLETDRIKEYLS